MKTQKIISLFSVVALCILSLVSCTNDAVKPTVKGTVAANELLAPSATAYILTLANKDSNFETFKWTASDFGFPTFISYKLQMDKQSGNFTTPIEVASVTNGALTTSITVGAMNEKLLGMGLAPQSSSSIKLRVVSTINDNVKPVISNERTISVTPYAIIFPSIWGMGDALKGWGPWPGAAVEFPSSEFKKYETIAYLTNGNIFRFFEQQDWGPSSYNYEYFTTVDSKFSNGGGNDKNFKVEAATGWYKISVDLLAKTLVVTASTEPLLVFTGDAQGAWGWNVGQYVKMNFIKPGVFEATATFQAGKFRFFAAADWGADQYKFSFFKTVDNQLFEAANDGGDDNFRFKGTPGSYKIRVDLNEKTVVKVL
jgi:starch-binding outer membrane protein SusE/F